MSFVRYGLFIYSLIILYMIKLFLFDPIEESVLYILCHTVDNTKINVMEFPLRSLLSTRLLTRLLLPRPFSSVPVLRPSYTPLSHTCHTPPRYCHFFEPHKLPVFLQNKSTFPQRPFLPVLYSTSMSVHTQNFPYLQYIYLNLR